MERITAAQVRNAAAALMAKAAHTGLVDANDGWALQAGSRTDGRAWRLFAVPAGQTGYRSLSFAPASGYLGASAREALHALDAMRNTLYAVEDLQRAAVAATKARETKLTAAYTSAFEKYYSADETGVSAAANGLLDAVCDFLARNDETTGA